MKKLTSMLLVFVFLFATVVPASAANYNSAQGSSSVTYFNEAEAADIALLFVLNNMGKSENSWSSETVIDEVYTLYDFDNNVTGYTFMLSTNDAYSGYISVSAGLETMPIQEFSFTDLPTFEEKLSEESLSKTDRQNYKSQKNKKKNSNKIVFNGPMEYYINELGTFYDLDKKTVAPGQVKKAQRVHEGASQHNIMLKEIIHDSYMGTEYPGQLEGYAISNRFTYMTERYGDYTYEDSGSLSGFVGLNMSNYGGSNDCSLVSITAVANWYRSDYPDIPSTASDIYTDVLAIGKKHGYTTTGGTNPTVIDNIIEDSFEKWGYSVNATNTYVWSFSTFTNQIDAENPVLFNIATGYYGNHTVTVIGYAEYDVADFLMVKDNWSTSTRYIHWQQMWNEIGSVTTIDG